MRKQYGKEKGDEVFWGYINKNKLDETKPMSDQKAEATAELLACLDSDMDAGVELGQPGDRPGQQPQPTPTGDPTKPQGLGEADTDRPITIAPGSTALNEAPAKEVPLHGGMNRSDKEIPPVQATASEKGAFFSVPAYQFNYVAAPKFEGDDAPIIIKAVVLEEGVNVNGWRVLPDQFERVAEQYKAGRQLRTDHEKSVANVIGKSYEGKTVKGADLKNFIGKDIPGINPEGLYVVAEFEANPRDPQVRTNILNGYVVAGSIGLDAEALCGKCGTPLKTGEDGGMVRQCHHLDAIIDLTNVEVKEYSYVAEPAFEHTQAFPTFAAAVDSRFDSDLCRSKGKAEAQSSLLSANPNEKGMSTVAAEAAKKKAEGEGEGKAESDADARIARGIAEGIALYKKGIADAMKFRADGKAPPEEPDGDETQAEATAESEGEGEGEAEAKSEGESEGEAEAGVSSTPPLPGQKPKVPAKFAKQKTDQIARTAPSKSRATAKFSLMDRVHDKPTVARLESSGLKEIFIAAAKAPGAPRDVTNKLRGLYE